MPTNTMDDDEYAPSVDSWSNARLYRRDIDAHPWTPVRDVDLPMSGWEESARRILADDEQHVDVDVLSLTKELVQTWEGRDGRATLCAIYLGTSAQATRMLLTIQHAWTDDEEDEDAFAGSCWEWEHPCYVPYRDVMTTEQADRMARRITLTGPVDDLSDLMSTEWLQRNLVRLG